MATAFPIPLTAAQIGTYFVGQYYQVLQQQPEIVHQFYSDASSMLRIDGNARETATAMLQIHALIMSISFTGVEIKTLNALESWNGGVLVTISGTVQLKNFSGSRKFVQTFFLAPQETGYFILNDIFHFVEEDHPHHHPAVLLPQNNLNARIYASTKQETVPTYALGGEIHAREIAPTPEVKENGPADKYRLPERPKQAPEAEKIVEGNLAVDSSNPTQNSTSATQDHQSASADESAGEPQKHTYASILRVAKGQSSPSVSSQPPASKSSPPATEWESVPEPTTQQPMASSNQFERSGAEPTEESPGIDDDGEIKSVYVRNLPPTVSESEIEEEFIKFGKIRPDGVVIRGRKDLGVCYAFVEFEEMVGVQNAVKAATAQVAGRQVYIEERRPNSNMPSRGRRGRGRGSYQIESSRGRFGPRNFGRGSSQEGGDREYNRPRGNGFYRPSNRQDRSVSGQASKQNPEE